MTSAAQQNTDLGNGPNWGLLFGSGSLDSCNCQDCRSMYSPAAYLSDLINFAGTIDINNNVLFQRRPDLQNIGLSCENTETVIPYIDLVIEVLENYIVTNIITGYAPAPPASNPLFNWKNAGDGNGTDDDIRNFLVKNFAVSWAPMGAAGSGINNAPITGPASNPPSPNNMITIQNGNVGDQDYVNISMQLQSQLSPTSPQTIADVVIDDGLRDRQSCQLLVMIDSTGNNWNAYPLTQTNGTSSEVLANPEHTKVAVYDLLESLRVVYPLDLPFSLWIEQARTYLQQMGTTLYEVMNTMRLGTTRTMSNPALVPPTLNATFNAAAQEFDLSWDAPRPERKAPLAGLLNFPVKNVDILGYRIERSIDGGNTWSVLAKTGFWQRKYADKNASSTYSYRVWPIFADLHSALEYLKIIPNEFAILINFNATALYYGMNSTQEMQFQDTGNCHGQTEVQKFLDATRIQYSDLVDLVETNFINKKEQILLNIDPHCDLTQSCITNLDDTAFNRIIRFIRLWRKLGWQMQDLDKVITSLQADDIDSLLLVNIANISQIQARLQVPLASIISFWAPIDTDGDCSLYNQIFQNKTIKNPPDPAFELDNLGSQTLTISAHVATILAALNIDTDDLTAMTTEGDDDTDTVKSIKVLDNVLNLENLSKLYRIVTLSNGLNITTLSDLFSLVSLTKINPFDQLNAVGQKDVSNTLLFIEKADEISQSNFSVAELNYLIRNIYDSSDGIRPAEDDISQFLQDLRDKLQKIIAQTSNAKDPSGEILKKNLPLVLSPDKNSQFVDPNMINSWVQRFTSIINGISTESKQDQKDRVDELFSYIYSTAEEAETFWKSFSPSSLSAIPVSSEEIDLAWTAPPVNGKSSIAGYMVERSINGGKWNTLVANTSSTLTYYKDTTVNPGQQYSYRVSAIDAAVHTSDPSPVANVIIPANGMSFEPELLTASLVPLDQTVLTWTAPAAAAPPSGYMIERSLDGGNTWLTLVENTNSNMTSYADINLAPNQDYAYRVSALYPPSKSDPSNVVLVTSSSVIASPPPPASANPNPPPTGLGAKQVSSMAIDLDWKQAAVSVPQTVGYMIERSIDGGNTWSTLEANTGTTTTSYQDYGQHDITAANPVPNLKNSTTCSYRVRTVSAGTPSSPSVGPATNTDSTTPTNFAVQPPQGGSIVINWNAPNFNNPSYPLVGYLIERNVSADKEVTWSGWQTLVVVLSGVFSSSDSQIDANHQYSYRVSSLFAGDPSVQDSVETPTSGTPSAPTKLVASCMSQNEIDINWDAPAIGNSSIMGYLIERSSDGGNTWSTLVPNTNSTATSYSDRTVVAGVMYSYRVTALVVAWNYPGGPPLSNAPSVNNVIQIPAVGTPTEFQLAWNQQQKVNLPASIEGYIVERSTDGLTWTVVTTTNATTSNYDDKDVGPDPTNNEYRVGALIGGITSDPSSLAETIPSTIADRFSYVTSRIMRYLQCTNLIEQMLGSFFKMDGRIVHMLLVTDFLSSDESLFYTEIFTGGFADSDPSIRPSESDFPSLFDLIYQMHKSSLLVNKFNISPDELMYLAVHSFDFVGFSLRFYSKGQSMGTSFSFEQWEKLVNLFYLKNSLSGSTDIFAFLDGIYAPLDLTAKLASSGTEIDLSWKKPLIPPGTEAVGYILERSNDGIKWSTIAQTDGKTTSYQDTNLEANPYSYRVSTIVEKTVGKPLKPINSLSYASSPSAPTDFITTPQADTPSEPVGLTVTLAPSGTEIDLNWTAPVVGSQLSAYRIERSNDNGSSWTTLPPNPGSPTSTQYQDKGLIQGSYIYRVSAVNISNNTSIPSDQSFPVTIPQAGTPSSPTNLKLTVSLTQIDLGWTQPVIIGDVKLNGYKIERSDDNGTSWNAIAPNADPGKTTWTDSHVKRTVYTLYRVSAINSAGNTSVPSEPAAVTSDLLFDAEKSGLVELTGWNAADADKLISDDFNLFYFFDFRNADNLVRIKKCFDLANRLGVAADQLYDWATITINSSVAREIKNSLKAKYSDDTQWLNVATQLENSLRDKKESALVSFLVWEMSTILKVVPAVTNADEMFNYFLIDVQMSSCRTTSRISQAITSVQLFIQRILLNLENENNLSPTGVDMEWWSWMESFSLWQPNRKVFLYPENYLVPNLRKTASPFFDELVDELSQKPISNGAAQDCIVSYLTKLSEVAHLEVQGMFYYDDGAKGIIHAFARTSSSPQTYYHRTFDRNTMVWSAWQKVEAIDGDNLIPAVLNGRVYVFWPKFDIASDDASNPQTQSITTDGSGNMTTSSNPPLKYYKITMSWAEYKNGKWSSKRTSSGVEGTIEFPNSQRYPPDPNLDLNYPISGFSFQYAETPEGFGLIWLFNNGQFFDSFLFEPSRNKMTETFYTTYYWVDTTVGYSPSVPSNLIAPPLQDSSINCNFFDLSGSQIVISNQTIIKGSDYEASLLPRVLLPDNDNSGLQKFSYVKPPPYDWDYSPSPFFLLDNSRSFYVDYLGIVEVPIGSSRSYNPVLKKVITYTIYWRTEQYRFSTFYNPHVDNFFSQLNQSIHQYRDLSTFFSLSLQTDPYTSYSAPWMDFNWVYNPEPLIVANPNGPSEDVDFNSNGAYSLYNWELFFHIPFLVATKLSLNQMWDKSRKWFHYIFNPASDSPDPSPQRYWNFKPFYDEESNVQANIVNVQDLFNNIMTSPDDFANQVKLWRDDPFDPYLMADIRQHGVYEKAVVMKYIDNLIGWGNYLFGQFTSESVNEATELYVLARELLGERPQCVPPTGSVTIQTWQTLNIIANDPSSTSQTYWSDFADAYVELENEFPFTGDTSSATSQTSSNAAVSQILATIPVLYFCIPRNDKLLNYWKTVDEMLDNIRQCKNSQGVVSQPALFPPPINPMQLVQAAAMGMDVSTAMSDINAPVPYYRFKVMIQKALEICSEVKALGASLLSALEKGDAEHLSTLRATQEANIQKAIIKVKQDQVDEATKNITSLNKAKIVAQDRRDYYKNLTPSTFEAQQLNNLQQAWSYQQTYQIMQGIAAGLRAIPSISFGIAGGGGSPLVTMSVGGENLAAIMDSIAAYYNGMSAYYNFQANLMSISANDDLRQQDWTFQAGNAQKDMDHIDAEIEAANKRQDIAQKEMKNQNKVAQNALDVQTFLQSKFTTEDLYDWMASQVSSVYSQSYQMAYDLAKKTEKAYQFETGDTASTFIQFGYWDNLRKGLLAGEQLYFALKSLEKAYLEQDQRYYEITKNISLAMLDPNALISLIEKGSCTFTLPEFIFDMDFPGHFMRRIKTVSITIPCVAGPYTSINCILTQLNNKIRTSATVGGKPEKFYDDSNFVSNFANSQSIATSHGQNDTGMFELKFDDERYLPFEGSGVYSQWLLEMPQENFDFSTISDVIIKVSYTARDGGDGLKAAAKAAYNTILAKASSSGLARMFSARHEFPNEWQAFLNPADLAPNQSLTIVLKQKHFPFQLDPNSIKINKFGLYLRLKKQSFTESPDGETLAISLNGKNGNLSFDDSDFMVDKMMHWETLVKPVLADKLTVDVEVPRQKSIVTNPNWMWKQDDSGNYIVDSNNDYTLDPENIEDLIIVCYYTATPKDMPKYFGG